MMHAMCYVPSTLTYTLEDSRAKPAKHCWRSGALASTTSSCSGSPALSQPRTRSLPCKLPQCLPACIFLVELRHQPHIPLTFLWRLSSTPRLPGSTSNNTSLVDLRPSSPSSPTLKAPTTNASASAVVPLAATARPPGAVTKARNNTAKSQRDSMEARRRTGWSVGRGGRSSSASFPHDDFGDTRDETSSDMLTRGLLQLQHPTLPYKPEPHPTLPQCRAPRPHPTHHLARTCPLPLPPWRRAGRRQIARSRKRGVDFGRPSGCFTRE